MAKLPVDRLQPGIFISLAEMGWLDHPFLLNRFVLNNPGQIKLLREMGLKEVEWDPVRSTAKPLPEASEPEEEIDFGGSALGHMLDMKRDRAAKVRAQRESLARSERLYEQETVVLGEVFREIGSRPNEAHAKAKSMVGRVVSGLLEAESVAVHLVNMKAKEAGLAHHGMNVMVIALLLGKEAKLGEEDMRSLGLGALFHDVGKSEIPPMILRSLSRSPAEEQFYQAHVGYGIKNVAGVREMTTAVRNIIACHHECWDGQGFPNRLAGAKIPRLARIVALANRYDNLCNPFDIKVARTPSEAVAHMFKRESGRFDPELLQILVKAMGVYPPGSFVSLSNGSVGLVVETNSRQLLRPLVMLYDASVPRQEALLLDLSETDLSVGEALSPAKLPVEVVEYLAPRGRVDYYIQGAQ